jgi:hypothetical protein
LDAQQTLLSFKPRQFGAEFDCAEDLIVVTEVAKTHGLNVKRVHQEGSDIYDCVIVLQLTRE